MRIFIISIQVIKIPSYKHSENLLCCNLIVDINVLIKSNIKWDWFSNVLLVSFWAEMSTDNIPTQIYYKTSDSKNPGVHIHIGRLLIAVFHKGYSL